MKQPSMRENMGQLYGVHSFQAKAERALAVRRLADYQEAELMSAKVRATAARVQARRRVLRLAYLQGIAHGLGYGFILGGVAGSACLAGLLLIGIKVGP